MAGGGGRESEHCPAYSPTIGQRMAVNSLGMSVLLPGMMVNNLNKIDSPEEFARDVAHWHKQHSQATPTKALLVLNGQESGAMGGYASIRPPSLCPAQACFLVSPSKCNSNTIPQGYFHFHFHRVGEPWSIFLFNALI